VLARAMAHALAHDLDFLCLLPRLETRGFWAEVLMPNLFALFYLGPSFLFVRPALLGWAIVAGAGSLISRRAYEAVGGHEALKGTVVDDVALARLVKRAGYLTGAATVFDCARVRMYEGFREIVNGFTKNIAFVFDSAGSLLAGTFFFLFLTWFPLLALAVPGRGTAVTVLSLLALGSTLAGRIGVARVTRTPVWSAFFHPLMMTVWSVIAWRSLLERTVGKRVVWRGRSFPSGAVRFPGT